MNDRVCERCHKILRVEGDVCPDDGGRLLTVSTPEALLGRNIEGKLELTGILGVGGMGVVYRARQHSMDREVAVKILNPSFAGDAESVQRFLHEAKTASRLDHPNIITVFDFGQTQDGLLYIVMELLSGKPLAHDVDAGRIEPTRAIHILTQVADAVHHAHTRGLVHRDLKPENIFLLPSTSLRGEFVKVLDFGIAQMKNQEGVDRITRTGSVCGTPAYMSPEQVLGDEIDPRSDVYALGIIAFEMLTGLHPLRAETPMRQMMAHLEGTIPTFAHLGTFGVPAAVEQAVRHALEKKKEQRTSSALEFANELAVAMGGASLAPTTPSSEAAKSTALAKGSERMAFAETGRATPLPPRASRAYVPYIVVALLIVGALVFFLTRDRPANPKLAGKTDTVAERGQPGATPTDRPGNPPAPAGKGDTDVALPSAATPDTATELRPSGAVTAPELRPSGADTNAPATEKDDTHVALPSAPDTAPAASAPVMVMIASTPPGAQVVVDGVSLGTTPLAVQRPAGETPKKVVLKVKGRAPKSLELGPTGDATLTVKLEPAPAASPSGTKPDGGQIE
jgi:serine/threonine-protein kinase